MTVKRYTPTQCCEHDGTYVTYSDSQKLVTENAELKLIINEVGDLSLSPHIQKLCEIKTPNTDAAIAEIKGQGVDEWIESRNGRWNGTTKEAEEFAANLRAGRKG